jgi:hypothetical protein
MMSLTNVKLSAAERRPACMQAPRCLQLLFVCSAACVASSSQRPLADTCHSQLLPLFPTCLVPARRLAKRQHMPHSTAMQLVSAVLDDQPVPVFVHCLGDMRPVKLWRCLTDAEFVEIMAKILQKRLVLDS